MKNKLIIINHNKETKIDIGNSFKLNGLNINIDGQDNILKIHQPLNISHSKINISSDDCYLEIKSSSRPITINIAIKNGNSQTILIDSGLSCGQATILMSEARSVLKIGQDCMFSSDILFLIGDAHQIFHLETPQIYKNWTRGIIIGNHVWIGRNVKLKSNCSIADNSVVALGALVCKDFTEKNVTIGGFPAKILSKEIMWNREALSIQHEKKLIKYNLNDYSLTLSELEKILENENDLTWKKLQIDHYIFKKKQIEDELNFLRNVPNKDIDINIIQTTVDLLLKVGKYNDANDILNKLINDKYINENYLLTIYIKKINILKKMGNADEIKALLSIIFSSKLTWTKADLSNILFILKDVKYKDAKFILNSKYYMQLISSDTNMLIFWYDYLIHNEYTEEAIDIGCIIMKHKLDLQFFVKFNNLLINKKRYDDAIYYLGIFKNKNRNSIWVYLNLIEAKKLNQEYAAALDLCYEAHEEFHNNIYISRKEILLYQVMNDLPIMKKKLIKQISLGLDVKWCELQLNSMETHQENDA